MARDIELGSEIRRLLAELEAAGDALVSASDIAHKRGMTRGNVHDHVRRREDFPTPIVYAYTGNGKPTALYLWSEVQAYFAQPRRRSGPKPRNANPQVEAES